MYGGANNTASVHFKQPHVFQDHNTASIPKKQFLINASGNFFGRVFGFNGDNYPPAISPDILLHADYKFASGALTNYPGSTGTISVRGTVVRAPQSFTIFGATGQNNQINFPAATMTLAEALAKAGGLQDMRSCTDQAISIT